MKLQKETMKAKKKNEKTCQLRINYLVTVLSKSLKKREERQQAVDNDADRLFFIVVT